MACPLRTKSAVEKNDGVIVQLHNTGRKMLGPFVLLLLLLAIFPSGARAQRGTITGVVADESGNVVAGARITLLLVDRGLRREAETAMDGRFLFRLLQTGNYVLTAEKDGFFVSEMPGLGVAAGNTVRLRVLLRIGTQSTTIRVTESADQVRSENAFPNEGISPETLLNAPAARNDVTGLAALLPGVVPDDGDRASKLRYHIAGARSDSITFLLDGGLDNNLLDNRIAYMPQLDSIEQIHVLVSNYPTEYGRNSGGIVTMTTKSGTVDWHGSAFDFVQNEAFNANGFFNKNDPQNLLPRDVLRQNQFGATFGGPLRFPGVAHKKANAFFFVAYQGTLRHKTTTIHNVATFTPAQVDGDFSHSAVGGTPDPGVAAFLQAVPYFQSDPALAAQAIIDPNRLSPVAQAYFRTGLIPVSPTGQITSQGRNTLEANDTTAKIDWNVNETNKLSATFGVDQARSVNPFSTANVIGFSVQDRFTEGYFRLSYAKILSSHALNELSITENRNIVTLGEPMSKLSLPNDLGVHIAADSPTGPPNVIFSSGLSVGFSENGPSNYSSNTLGLNDILSLQKGQHHWTLGGGLSDFRNNTKASELVNGQFYSSGSNTLNDLADFVIGLPSAYEQAPYASLSVRSRFTDFFAEDEWSMKHNFVLTLGLRYEYSSPKSDTQNRFYSILPGQRSFVFPNAPVGMVFRGDPGVPHGVNFPDKNNFAPRLSFAWSPGTNAKTTLRGGAGIFYDILKAEDNLQFSGQPPFFSSASLSFSFPPPAGAPLDALSYPYESAGARDPFPSRNLNHQVDFLAEGFLPIGGLRDVYVVDPHLRTPLTYQYSLSVQHELPGGSLLEVAYVGSQSHGLTALTDINPIVLGTYDRILNLTPGNSTCGFNAPDNTCSFAAVHEFKNLGWSLYNSANVRWQRRLFHNERIGDTSFNFSYTFSHSQDNSSGFVSRNPTVPYYNTKQFHASSDFDVRQRIVLSGGWTLPLQHYLGRAPARLTQGWSIYPVVIWRTGFPLDIFANLPGVYDYTSPGPSGAGDSNLVRANLIGPIQLLNPRQYQSGLPSPGNYWFNPLSFSNAQCFGILTNANCQGGPGTFPSDAQVVSNPSLRTYGSLPRNYFRGPGRSNVDLAVSKTVPLKGERILIELRGDFFNLLNHAEFLSPNTNINDSNFGQVQNTADPRIIQLSLRLRF